MKGSALYIGTSGWHYQHWRNRFYPADLPPAAWLSYYADRFFSVELNSSFYKLPEPSAIEEWVEQTPSHFLFAVKASRFITHMKKLRDCAPVLETFLSTVRGFGKKLGPVLFQLPPRWRVNAERLAAFLEHVPPRQRYAFEFRDPSWHTDAVYALLETHNCAFCHFDLAGFQSPEIITADFAYVRLHGPHGAYAGSYSDAYLRRLGKKLVRWSAQGRDAYVFFDNDESAYAAANAKRLIDLCTQAGFAQGQRATRHDKKTHTL